MVVVLEQDLELVVHVFVSVVCLLPFNGSGGNGRVVLFTVMGRDVLPASARKELGLESGICDLQPVSQADLFVAASIEEHFTDSSTAAKAYEATEHLHCRGDVGENGRLLR